MPTPAGTSFVVNNGPGDQTNPHVSGNLVTYTDTATVPGSTVIRYYDIATGSDAMVPNNTPGSQDYLSDVNGSRIVFIRSTPQTNGAILLYDTATGNAPVEIAPQAGSARTNASIGGNTVAWEDAGINPAQGNGEIVTNDLTSGVTTTLTGDNMQNTLPAVSPDGGVIVWIKCDASTFGFCDVWQATRSAGTWSTKALTTDHGSARPDTNGSVVVYSKGSAGNSDVFMQPVGGGPEQNLTASIGGINTNPSMSGNLVAFEHTPAGTAQTDIWVIDVSTGAAFPVTNTPTNETLTDISASAGGTVNVVWVRQSATTGEDVLGFQYSLDAPLTIRHAAAGASDLRAAAGVTFTDGDPAGTLGQYSATVDWGDGSTSAAMVVINPFGGFAAGGLHTYATLGTYAVTLTIHDVGGATTSMPMTITAHT